MNLSAYDYSLWRAMFSVAFFGCFRVSEFLISKDHMKILCPDKVVFRDDGAVEFLLYKTKNNSRGQIQEVLFGALGDDPICPAATLKDFIGRRLDSKCSYPLFVNEAMVPITP